MSMILEFSNEWKNKPDDLLAFAEIAIYLVGVGSFIV
jgi:hypothetical protein